MKTLIIDCDGVLYPESLAPLSKLLSIMKNQAFSYNITPEQYEKISNETLEKKEEGMYNFILNLMGKNMNLFHKFCKTMIDSNDYSKIKRDEELFELLLKTSKKYEIYILTNNYITHLDKVYEKLFGMSLEKFPFKSFDITSTFRDGKFYPKQSENSFIYFLQKINKKNYECIVCDDSIRNIKRCIEYKIPYEHITNDNTLKNVLKKLNQ